MLADSQKSADSSEQILDLKVVNGIKVDPVKKPITQPAKYQCIVCQLNKSSLSDLHRHQTYQHSTEELSLSIIGRKGLVKIIQQPSSQEKQITVQKSIWSSLSKKPSQFYYLSSNILQPGKNDKENDVPLDCTLPLKKVDKDTKILKRLKKNILSSKKIKEFTKPLEFDMKENRNNNSEIPMDCTTSCFKKENILSDSSFGNRIKKESIKERNKTNEIIVDTLPLVKVSKLEVKSSIIKQEQSSIMNDKLFSASNLEENSDTLSNEWIVTKNINLKEFLRGTDELCKELEELTRLAALKKTKKRKWHS